MTRYVRNMSKSCVSGWFFSSCFSCITCQAGLRLFEDSKALFYSHHKLRTVRLSAIFVFAALIFSWPPVTNTICFINYCLLCFCFFFRYSEYDIPEMWDQYTRIIYILFFLFWLPETSEDLGTISLADRIASRSLSTGMVQVASLLAGWFVGIDELQIHFRPVFLLVI